ncbi:sigma-E processing peptidase SpoIIGA [Brassicibacter mesophilus]|uniref:sigma-E processing peptidase SpoIIGA n=1 Tax=Brassicibacter mesophilus TaxID=745119 RepID=UPI003D195794
MYIYAEYLLLENIVINYIILYVTKRFTRTKTHNFRLLLASIIGALYTLVVFFPSLRFMTRFIVKISISILIIIVAFNPAKLRKFIKLFATFYVVAFVFAGAALALFYLTDVETYVGSGIFYIKNFPIKLLIFAVVMSSILIKLTWGYIQTKMNKSKNYIPITINLNNRKADIVALLDTGNSLKDPISQTPVIIVQFSAIKDLLPERIQTIFIKYKENNLDVVSAVMSETSSEFKFRLIPYKSLGKDNGMLLGFKPDSIIIKADDDKSISDIVIGIYNNNLSSDDEYTALLHPEILTEKGGL